MRAIRILQANWLNAEVSGDRGTVKSVSDEMARDAVEVHHIAEYAPEYDQPPAYEIPIRKTGVELIPEKPVVVEFPAREPEDLTGFGEEPSFVGTEAAAARLEALQEMVTDTYDEAPAELKMPWSNASKADWIGWAAHGNHGQPRISEEAAAALTKNELMSKYGERL